MTVSDQFNVLRGYIVTKLGPNPGQDNNNQRQPYAVTLPANGINLTADFGYIQPAAIGDYVWYDADQDGIQDVFEPPIGNVKLELWIDNGDNTFNTVSDTLFGTQVTDVDGGYLFAPLVPNLPYFVKVADSNFTAGGVLEGLTKTSGPQSKPTPFGTITVEPGDAYRDADFGYVKLPGGNAIIGDTVWYDGDGDGLRDPGEAGIPNVIVCAVPVGGGTAICDTTDNNGMYLVSVPPGSYTVSPSNPPAGYTATTPVPHGPVTVAAGNQYLDADFGYRNPSNSGSISGTVWNDVNDNGLLEGGEPRIGSVSVSLIRDTNGNGKLDTGEPIIATNTTTGNGDYDFTGLPAGTYLVQVTDTQRVLDDYTLAKLGPNPGQDNNNQKQPYAINLPANGNNSTADFGYLKFGPPGKLGIIGNQVWFERVINGIYSLDNGDRGIAGVTVDLRKDGVFYKRTTTGASGDYIFTSLPAGNYSVLVSDINGVLSTNARALAATTYIPTVPGPNPGQDNNNQVPQPYSIILPNGGTNLTADFGYRLVNNNDYAITKRLKTPEPIRRGDLLTFTIVITNIGTSPIVKLPLTDTYDVNYLTYAGVSTPQTNDFVNDGVLNWSDLTAVGTKGFGQPLNPGQSFTINVQFIAYADTTNLAAQAPCIRNGETCNVALVNGAFWDPDGVGGTPPQSGLPALSDKDDANVLSPTSVALADASMTFSDAGVALQWQTHDESNFAGFELQRWENGTATIITTMSAEKAGQPAGSTYHYLDNTVESGKIYVYELRIMSLDGSFYSAELGQISTGQHLYLPDRFQPLRRETDGNKKARRTSVRRAFLIGINLTPADFYTTDSNFPAGRLHLSG